MNTPVNQSAPENQIADMWRERFGLILSPIERLKIYIQDYSNWSCNYDEKWKLYVWHYIHFPEFTFEYSLPDNISDYNPRHHANAIFANSIGNSYETSLRYKYHTTVLKSESLYICDKARYYWLHPHTDWLYYDPENYDDLHVFIKNAQKSDRGKSIDEIDFSAKQGGRHRQITFFYNIKNSSYNLYDDYRFSYIGAPNYEENKGIICPEKIFLIEPNENIATRLKTEFKKLQKFYS